MIALVGTLEFQAVRVYARYRTTLFSFQDKWTRSYHMQRRQQLLDGTIWSLDTLQKFVKFVCVRGKGIDSKQFLCVMTIFNEFQRVCLECHMA